MSLYWDCFIIFTVHAKSTICFHFSLIKWSHSTNNLHIVLNTNFFNEQYLDISWAGSCIDILRAIKGSIGSSGWVLSCKIRRIILKQVMRRANREVPDLWDWKIFGWHLWKYDFWQVIVTLDLLLQKNGKMNELFRQ